MTFAFQCRLVKCTSSRARRTGKPDVSEIRVLAAVGGEAGPGGGAMAMSIFYPESNSCVTGAGEAVQLLRSVKSC